MEKASGGKPAARFGFDFSWADEVEREEREQQAMEQQGREEEKKEQPTRSDPFGAARPREVVLAEKGVDWRARDRELDAAAAATRGHRHVAVSAARAPAASRRARIVPAPACASRSTPARRGRWDRGSGRTPDPRRHDAESTPQAKGAPPVSRSAWGGGKRKCAGEVPAPATATATARRVRAVGEQGRKVFGELNVGEGCGSTFRSAGKKRCNSGASETEGSKSSEAAVVEEGGGSRGCSLTAATATTVEDQSAVGQKRKGRKKGRRAGSKKTENQQTLLV